MSGGVVAKIIFTVHSICSVLRVIDQVSMITG